jgi:cytidylate kinase
MLITIDGPAGTGKSTAARGLAERLGFSYLDTGAMYRAVGLACLERGVDPHSLEGCAAVAREVTIKVDGRRTWLDGVDVTDAIRTPASTAAASIVAQNPAVRSQLVNLQRRCTAGGDYVCEGRDQGTVVFPQAQVKFFITASPEVRAERRRQELAAKGEQVALQELLQQQSERDRRDEERDVAPMRPAEDAILIDTSTLSTDEVISRMESRIHATRG